MNNQNIFPVQAFAGSMSESSVSLEGQKVVFDKKVSLLPVDIKKQEPVKVKQDDGGTRR
jgi:hypothetical protein